MLRTIDIAAAATIGIIAVVLINQSDPSYYVAQQKSITVQMNLDEMINSYIAHKGLSFFQTSSLSEICSSILSYSNKTYSLFMSSGNFFCNVNNYRVCKSIELTLVQKELVLGACYAGTQ